MKKQQSGAPLLRTLAALLMDAETHPDGRSIVAVSPILLRLWGERLAALAEPKGLGAPGKSDLHHHWAISYWVRRTIAPADIKGAIETVQLLTQALEPGAQAPTAATIQRVARKHRKAALDVIGTDPSADLAPLLDYLEKHERRGRE